MFRLGEMSVAEWAVTDAHHWHELMQAWSSFTYGLQASGGVNDGTG